MSWRSLNNLSAGLTLIEMMVVIAIFIIITVVVLADLPALKNRLSLDLLAEEVALAIRQAQVYAVATRTFGGDFPSQAVFISVSLPTDSFIVFADSNNNNVYDEGNGCGKPPTETECREKFTLPGGVKIRALQFCPATSNGDHCEPPATGGISVFFIRPNPDAKFYKDDGYPYNPPNNASYLKLELYSEKIDDSRGIAIWRTGHIYTCRNYNAC